MKVITDPVGLFVRCVDRRTYYKVWWGGQRDHTNYLGDGIGPTSGKWVQFASQGGFHTINADRRIYRPSHSGTFLGRWSVAVMGDRLTWHIDDELIFDREDDGTRLASFS